MAYIKNTWVDQEVERPKTYEMINNSDGSVTLVDSFGLVSELGTPVNADNMNHIEEGIAAGSFTKFDLNTTYGKNDLVTVIEDGSPVIYKSLVDNNFGNALSSSIAWEKISLGGGGLEIGDIGIAPLGIDETKGKRRYLNGQVVIQNQYPVFSAKVKQAISLYPSLGSTESEWQTTVTMSAFGECGKFVVDDEAGTIRLPKITGFIQGLTDLASLGDLVGAGLPQHTHALGATVVTNVGGAGAKIDDGSDGHAVLGISGTAYADNHIYGKSETVQPESILYPYFIQVATGAETEADITNEIELNNPFFFGMSQYFDVEPNNVSWLKSNGQWNSKALYPSYYDWILANVNGGVEGFKGQIGYAFRKQNEDVRWWTANPNPKVGDAVYGDLNIDFVGYVTSVNSDGTIDFYDEVYSKALQQNLIYTPSENINIDGTGFGSIQFCNDYDFVINTANETFRLPNTLRDRVLIRSSNLINGYNLYSDGYLECFGIVKGTTGTVTLPVSYKDTGYKVIIGNQDNNPSDYKLAHTSYSGKTRNSFQYFNGYDGTALDMYADWFTMGYADIPEVNLYFYVGETVQNANLINAGRIEETLVNKSDIDFSNVTTEAKSLMSRMSMPSGKYIGLGLGVSGSTYTVPANGWMYFSMRSGGFEYISLHNLTTDFNNAQAIVNANWQLRCILPVRKGDVVRTDYNATGGSATLRFFYAEGEV